MSVLDGTNTDASAPQTALAGPAAPATPATTRFVQPLQTQDAAPLTDTIATQNAPVAPTAYAPHRGVVGTIAHKIVNTYGQPDEPGTIDDAGKYVQAAAIATPGQLFKNLLMGALSGMSNMGEAQKGSGLAGGIAAGLAGGIRHDQQQDAEDRGHAQQDFQNKNAAQAATNADLLMKANIAHINLQAEGQAQLNAQNKTLFPLEVQEKVATIAGTDAEHEKTMRAMGYTPAPVQADGSNAVNGYTDATPQMQQDLATGKIGITPSNSPSSPAAVHAWTAPPDDARIPQDITIHSWKLDPKTNKPVVNEDVPAYTLKAGTATAGQARIAVAQEYAQRTGLVNDYLRQADTQSSINQHNAEAGEANTRMKLIQGEIKDKDEARAANEAWGDALNHSDNDDGKALGYLKQHYPAVAGRLAAAESQVIAKSGEVQTVKNQDGTETTVTKMQRLFSAGMQPAGTGQAGPGQVMVQIPGQPPAPIDASQLAAFKAKHPDGKVISGGAEAESPSDQVVVKFANGTTDTMSRGDFNTYSGRGEMQYQGAKIVGAAPPPKPKTADEAAATNLSNLM